MSTTRQLPKKRNPLIAPDQAPDHAELASRRRLGSTMLSVKPGQVSFSNATKPENLGVFEYAHLRAPLPEDLKGSEIFAPQTKSPNPHAYFLMRRSSDGFVSATGMFKASFPWAKKHEEDVEKNYLKEINATSTDDVAGNVWVPERFALELAEEYGITSWVLALLDPAPVAPVNEETTVNAPPKFVFTASDKAKLEMPAPSATPAKGRGRPKAGSPVKATPAGKQSSPRKRTTKAVKEANAAAARQASENLQAVLDTTAPSVTESTADSEQIEEEKVVVTVKTAVEVKGDVETTHTNVQVKMPAGAPDLPPPESTEDMIEKAKQMVEEAIKLEGDSSKKAGKRKAELVEDAEEGGSKELQVAKRPKLEQEVRKQRVRNRALFGVAASLALGAIVPYVLGG